MRDLFGLEETAPSRILGKEIRKKVLCIALNYAHSSSPVFGNVQACTSLMQALLIHGHYIQQKMITDINTEVTKKTINDALDWLTEDAEDGDILMLIVAGRGSLELSDGSQFTEFAQLADIVPLGTTLFILSDVYLPLESRFLCKDISSSCTNSKQVGSKNMPILSSKSETRRYEEMSKRETCSTVLCLYSAEGSTGHLAFMLDYLLNNVYAYSITLQALLQYAQACMVVNKLNIECNLESGQYMDLQVPLGRLLHLPI